MPRKILPDEIPGVSELVTMCEQAKRVSRLCEHLGFEFRGSSHLISHLTDYPDGLLHGHPDPVEVLEDPDLRPYIWDLED